MKDIVKIIVAVLLVVLAWKILKGVLSILVTVAAVGLLIWGGMKLLDGGRKRIK